MPGKTCKRGPDVDLFQLTVQHGIPMPPPRVKRGTMMRLILKMRVGDSLHFSGETELANLAKVTASRLGAHLIFRKTENGVRTWLTKLPERQVAETGTRWRVFVSRERVRFLKGLQYGDSLLLPSKGCARAMCRAAESMG